jgi:hypothetical protein
MTTDEAISKWMGTDAFKSRYVDWCRAFDERQMANADDAIMSMVYTLCLPYAIARRLFEAEIKPERTLQ